MGILVHARPSRPQEDGALGLRPSCASVGILDLARLTFSVAATEISGAVKKRVVRGIGSPWFAQRVGRVDTEFGAFSRYLRWGSPGQSITNE